MDLPILVGGQSPLLVGGCAVALALAIALSLPNVPQLFRYREYRRAPERGAFVRWRPNGAWALVTALAFAISLFGMWPRLEFFIFSFECVVRLMLPAKHLIARSERSCRLGNLTSNRQQAPIDRKRPHN